MNSHELTALTDCTTMIQTMRLMVESFARQLFFFLIKNKKAGSARKMMWFLFFFKLLVTKLLLRTDAIPYRPIFIYTRAYMNCITSSISP